MRLYLFFFTSFEAISENTPNTIPNIAPKIGPIIAIAIRGWVAIEGGKLEPIEAISGWWASKVSLNAM
ncbi:MAG: hypothetical protein NVSMB24_36100 [Mucilaginibacter sp.]